MKKIFLALLVIGQIAYTQDQKTKDTTKTEELETVFITANRTATLRKATPVAISKITAKTINKRTQVINHHNLRSHKKPSCSPTTNRRRATSRLGSRSGASPRNRRPAAGSSSRKSRLHHERSCCSSARTSRWDADSARPVAGSTAPCCRRSRSR